MRHQTLRDKALAHLQSHSVMTLATTGPQGLWAAAVFYASDGFTLYFVSAPTSRHSRNIAAHPGIAATIQKDYRDWRDIRGIQLEGRAQLIEGRERGAAITRYGLKFPAAGENPGRIASEISAAMQGAAWYRLVSERLYLIDNSLGLGHRDAVTLDTELLQGEPYRGR